MVPLLSRAVARRAETPVLYRYYWDTIEACAPPASVLQTLGAAGFTGVQRAVHFGIFSEFHATARSA
jgi:demethylmenaquinone methyltransferase/2-methoxy-6-polyprenyl-1,4-benzoquinol methylase